MSSSYCRMCGAPAYYSDPQMYWFCKSCGDKNVPHEKPPRPRTMEEWEACRRWVNAEEAGEILKKSTATIYQWNRKGSMPAPVANDPLAWRRKDIEQMRGENEQHP